MTSLELGIHFLDQSFLEKRIDGLKLVSDAAAHCLSVWHDKSCELVSGKQNKSLEQKLKAADNLAKKLEEGGAVLRKVFAKDRTHAQLVLRSEQLLRLLMYREALSSVDWELLWEAGEINGGELRVELFKVLIGAAPDMRLADRQHIMLKIQSEKPENLTDRHVELATEVCATARKQGGDANELESGVSLLWSIATESESHCAP